MENFELIHRFLDGDLDAAQEAEFFGELSASDELRQELKEQMAMKSAIRRDYKAFTPAAASTVAIFSKLGFAGGAAAAGAAAGTALETAAGSSAGAASGAAISSAVNASVWQSVRAFLAGHSGNFVVGLSSAAAAAVAVFLMLRPGPDEAVNNFNKSINKISPSESVAKAAPQPAELTASAPKVIYKYIVVERKSEAGDAQAREDEQTAETLAPERPAEIARVERSQAVRLVSEPRLALDEPYAQARPIDLVAAVRELNGGNKLGVSLELRSSNYAYDAPDKLSPKHKQVANNFAIALFKNITEDFSIGLDYRRESFMQKYDGMEYILVGKGENQRLLAEPTFYSQEANFQTYSLAARYKITAIDVVGVSPTLGASLGANQVGAVGRVIVGASYMPYDWFEILASYDYSVMRFDHQNKWFTAAKSGLHLGAAIKF
ncbi:MAG: anti-sigma factor family protein [Chloroflexota bacterium]